MNSCMLKSSTLLLSILIIAVLLSVGCAKEPDENQIKADLIGQRISGFIWQWKFDSPSEFKNFNIKQKRQNGGILEYQISVVLESPSSQGLAGVAELLVAYKKEGIKWKFINVTDNNTLKQMRMSDVYKARALEVLRNARTCLEAYYVDHKKYPDALATTNCSPTTQDVALTYELIQQGQWAGQYRMTARQKEDGTEYLCVSSDPGLYQKNVGMGTSGSSWVPVK